MPSSSAFLSFDPAPGPATTRSVLALTEPADARAEPLGLRLGLVAAHRLEPAGEDDRLAGPLGLAGAGFERLRADFATSRSSSASRLCSSWKKSTSASATTGPTPSTADSSASARRRRVAACAQRLDRPERAQQVPRGDDADVADAEPEQEARAARARAWPRSRRGGCRPISPSTPRGRAARRGDRCRRKMSAGAWSQPSSTNSTMVFSPSPSMSSAPRLTKCLSRSIRCAGQISPPVQRTSTSPSSATASLPHSGQWSGKT